jgi:hypothetical protein
MNHKPLPAPIPLWVQTLGCATRLATLWLPACCKVLELFARLHELALNARRRFETSNDHVDIALIQFYPATRAAGGFGYKKRGAGAENGDDDVAAARQIEDRVLEHRSWFDGLMILQAAPGLGAEPRRAGRSFSLGTRKSAHRFRLPRVGVSCRR